ncbi:hypothetical protein J4T87_0011575 [Rhizobium sp. T1473]|uniref:hypothetical protein n=1 Tax=Rhizobium sp. T1473 TaxID=555321 RepID=UPI001ACB9055
MLWKLFAGALSLYLLGCIYLLYANEPTIELLVDGIMQLLGVAAVITYGFDIEIIDRRCWSYLSKVFVVYIVYYVVRPLWVLWNMPTSGTDPTTISLLWVTLGSALLLIIVVGYFQLLAMLRCARGEAVARR